MINSLLEKKFEGFSSLSDEECGRIVEMYLLEGLESETLFERELIAKFLVYPYPGREPVRKIFNAAIKKNRQRIAGLAVGEWIGKYIKKYENKERTPNTFFEFVNNSPETRILSKKDQTKLMRIFRMYDYLLVEPIYELDDVRMNILRFPMYLNEENPEMPTFDQKTDYEIGKPVRVESYSLLSAINQYPQLGEQLITSGMIRLKIFPQPVRPSIKNWIEDYRSVMGAERHGMMERGNYLFHTENTKRLASGERKKLAEVLRSLDEDVTLSVDPDRQEIIFNQVEEMKPVEKMSNSQFLPPQRDPAKAMANEIPSSQTQNKIPNTGYKIPDASMRFSSPHILPSEKNDKPSGYQAVSPSESSDLPKRQVFNSPSFDSKAGKPWEPASTSQRRGEPRVSGNTVDLRN